MKRDVFLGYLADLFERPKESLKGDDTLDSLEWDSIRAIEFISLVDEKLGKEVVPDMLRQCVCLDDLIGLVGDQIED